MVIYGVLDLFLLILMYGAIAGLKDDWISPSLAPFILRTGTTSFLALVRITSRQKKHRITFVNSLPDSIHSTLWTSSTLGYFFSSFFSLL